MQSTVLSMKIGLVSDIHGNHRALQRAFELMGAVDECFCLGDSIDQFRFSNEVVRLLQENCSHVIQGNHEEIFFAPVNIRAQSHDWIDRDLYQWLEKRPAEVLLVRAGLKFHLVHSTTWHPRGAYVTPGHKDFDRFTETDADVVVYGHTHVPTAHTLGSTLVINPGSTGQGSLVDMERKMHCAVFHTEDRHVESIPFSC